LPMDEDEEEEDEEEVRIHNVKTKIQWMFCFSTKVMEKNKK
jgi:hypothetical protein